MIEVYCDGGSRGNPGPAAFGYVVMRERKLIKEGYGYIGIATNNVAEYTAVIEALSWLEKHFPKVDLVINLDSKLAVSQLTGIYKVKDSKIRDLVFSIRMLANSFGQIIFRHIPRELNREADKLVNRALDEQIKKIKY